MLHHSYFDGTRRQQYIELMQRYSATGLVGETKVAISQVHLPDEMLEAAKKIRVDGQFLIPFSGMAVETYITKSVVAYKYPMDLYSDQKWDNSVEYKINKLALQQFLYYLQTGKTGLKIDYGLPIPPTATKDTDGQLKICTDFVLAIDDMLRSDPRDYYRILIIGSSSLEGRAGLSYEILPYMLPNAHITLVDPFEVTTTYSLKSPIGSTLYVKECRKFDYSELDNETYDFISDDSWVEGTSRFSRDVYGRVTNNKHFSVKLFPWDRLNQTSLPGRIYVQKFNTDGRENRMVSRNVDLYRPRIQPLLGECPGCRELSTRLSRDYIDEFYQYYMSVHRVNCITKRKLQVKYTSDKLVWTRVYPFEYDASFYYSVVDLDHVPGSKNIHSHSSVKGLRILASRRESVLMNIYHTAHQVLVVEYSNFGEVLYYVSRVIDEVPLEVDTMIKIRGKAVKVEPANITHDLGSTVKRKNKIDLKNRVESDFEYSLRSIGVIQIDETIDTAPVRVRLLEILDCRLGIANYKLNAYRFDQMPERELLRLCTDVLYFKEVITDFKHSYIDKELEF